MTRIDPPPLANWVLEHLSIGERNEALAGDLLEEFRAGRTERWYWGQVLAAVAVTWLENLGGRAPMLLFVILWSMAAPAWNSFCITVQSEGLQNRLSIIFGAIWIVPAFIAWTVLHLAFVWGGLLVFRLFYRYFGGTIHPARFKRAIFLAPIVFIPVYGALFLGVSLYWYSTFAHFQLQPSPLGQVFDLRPLANLIRIPYLLALLCALWKAAPPLPRLSSWMRPKNAEHSSNYDSFALLRELDPYTFKRFIAFLVGAGVVNAMIAGVILCRLPDSHAPSLSSLMIRAALYVFIGGLAGVAGAWFYWQSPASPFRHDSPVSFRHFALACAAGWVWIPAIVIFCEQVSAFASWIALIGAYLLSLGLRRITAPVFAPAGQPSIHEEAELFEASLSRPPSDATGYMISICLAAAGWALATRSNYTAAMLFACAGFLFAWKKTVPRIEALRPDREKRRATLRLVLATLPAVLITAWALLTGVAHRERDAVEAAIAHNAEDSRLHSGSAAPVQPGVGPGGFESVILWPLPPKKQIIPPLPAPSNFQGPEKSRPLIIRFDGPYWYFQPPNHRPGRTAHQAHGTPLAVNIETSNSLPLVMEAHQRLVGPVRISRCGEIDVEIENRDNLRGALSLALLLSDSALPDKPTLYLGGKQIETSMPGFFSYKSAPVFETVRFAIPATASIRKFDEITVILLPDIEHAMVGPKIAISQFELLPR